MYYRNNIASIILSESSVITLLYFEVVLVIGRAIFEKQKNLFLKTNSSICKEIEKLNFLTGVKPKFTALECFSLFFSLSADYPTNSNL